MTAMKFIIFLGILLCHFSDGRHINFEDIFPKLNMTGFFSEEHKLVDDTPKRICRTDNCKILANNILDSLDAKTDPCDDFYTYACGGWIRDHPVPATENHWNQFEILDNKLDSQILELLEEEPDEEEPTIVKNTKRIFHACMNINRIEKKGLKPLIGLLEELGNWPIATMSWNKKKFNWQMLITDVSRKLGVNAILHIYANVDRKNTSRYVLTVDEPDLGLPKYLLTHSETSTIEPYGKYITEVAELIARESGEKLFPFGIFLQSFDIISFEMKLAKILRNEEKRNANDLYDLVTIKKLQHWTDEKTFTKSYSRIDWKNLIRNLLGEESGEISDETPIVVTDWEFLTELMDLIDKTPPRVVANYVLWMVVKTMGRDLNKEMLDLNFKFTSQFSAVQEDYPRWRDCVLTAGYLSFAVGYMYVQKHFSNEAKAKAVEMVADIRLAFKRELLEVPWMDCETKKQALEKADFMNHFIGYPNWFDNITHLEEYYNGIKIGEDHFENKIQLRKFLSRKLWANLNRETRRDDWVVGPAIANAFYNPQLNSIIFPAGVLQEPFFDKDQPEALNYGSIGAVVGHEITHGFDDMGRQSDKVGNIKQWWSKDTEKTYLENARCFVNQYRTYSVPELEDILNTKVMINGVLTLDENIADNGGLRAALRAYKSRMENSTKEDLILPGLQNFTSEQLFYIGFARVWCESVTPASLLGEVLGESHSPNRIRVIGSLSNSEHFSKTWGCKLGSKMNPVNKCKLW